MIQIYGTPRSSSGRCYLVLEEIGLKYEGKDLNMMEKKEHKSPEYLKLNPNGKIPCLIDGDFVIWESLAINHYLADKYKPELLGKTVEERGLVNQWSTWSLVELQPPMVDILIQMLFVPEDKRDMKIVEKAREKIPPMLNILNQHLNHRQYMVGQTLTLADLNMATTINLALSLEMDLKPFAGISKWFAEIKSRPSFQRFVSARTTKSS